MSGPLGREVINKYGTEYVLSTYTEWLKVPVPF